MKPISLLALSLAAAVMALAPSARAAVTYVDADLGTNTVTTSGVASTWLFRTGYGTTVGNAGIYESYGADDPELKTTITVSAAGTYDVYVFYLSKEPLTIGETTNWPIRAGLTSNPGGNPLYDANGTEGISGTPASTLTFTPGADPVATIQGTSYVHYYAILGQVTVGAGGTTNVYVDDEWSTRSADRTWYDGVGYELVPEPSSLALLGLGGLFLLRRRR